MTCRGRASPTGSSWPWWGALGARSSALAGAAPWLEQCPALGSCWTVLGQGFWDFGKLPAMGTFGVWDVQWGQGGSPGR